MLREGVSEVHTLASNELVEGLRSFSAVVGLADDEYRTELKTSKLTYREYGSSGHRIITHGQSKIW